MRHLKLIVAGILEGAALAACVAVDATQVVEAPTPMPLDHHNFNYALEHREQVQLIQAFDNGARTFCSSRALRRSRSVLSSRRAERLWRTGATDRI